LGSRAIPIVLEHRLLHLELRLNTLGFWERTTPVADRTAI
jgi:hypothetical protein